MPYIGNTAGNRFVASKAASVYSGNGSTTAFTLEHAVGSDEDILVSVDGVIQEPSVAYAVSSGTTLTFTAAPSSNSGNNIFVYYLFRTVATVDHPSTSSLQATDGTFSGAVTANAGVVVDNITVDGTEIDLSSGDLTLDVAGDIILDAAGNQIRFSAGGTQFGLIGNESSDFLIQSSVQDKDIIFQGNDGGGSVTALTLNMSDGGTAQFNEKIQCSSINTGSSTGTLIMFGGGTNKGGTIELSGGNNTGSTGSGIVFKTGASTSSPSEKMRIDKNGVVTKPLQPAFLAQPTSVINNLAPNTSITVAYATQRYDQNDNYNESNYIFTAPVTGKYQFNVDILLENTDSAANYYQTQLTTTSRTYYHTVDPDFGQDNNYFNINVNVLADMDAGDTAKVVVYQAGGTQQTDINAVSTFTGFLVC